MTALVHVSKPSPPNPVSSAITGALIIVISSVYIAHREAKKRREAILEEQAAAGL